MSGRSGRESDGVAGVVAVAVGVEESDGALDQIGAVVGGCDRDGVHGLTFGARPLVGVSGRAAVG